MLTIRCFSRDSSRQPSYHSVEDGSPKTIEKFKNEHPDLVFNTPTCIHYYLSGACPICDILANSFPRKKGRHFNRKTAEMRVLYFDLQEQSKATASRHHLDYTEEERERIVLRTYEILKSQDAEEVLHALMQLSVDTNRRLGGTMWAARMCWESDDYLRSEFVDKPKNMDLQRKRIQEFRVTRTRLNLIEPRQIPKLLKSFRNNKIEVIEKYRQQLRDWDFLASMGINPYR